MSSKVIVGISEAKVSNNLQDTLVTYSLGSCVGVCIYDEQNKVGGMLHYQLPDSSLDKEKAKNKPAMFADTGIEYLIGQMAQLGANIRQLKIKIAGGAMMKLGPRGFDIGKQNHLAARKLFWKKMLTIRAQDIGGGCARNMYLDICDGSVRVKQNGNEKVL